MDLTQLEELPGAVDANFESLTRAVVTRRYGRFGTIGGRRQQPGVEFHVRVEYSGELGGPGRVWGWSCKWFPLNSKHELTTSQRNQIEDSFHKAIKHVDGLTDFVLCLPQRPSKKDVEWIDCLGAGGEVSTKLWAEEDFDAQLVGLEELRASYFGELILSPVLLANAHARSVAPVMARWAPELHTWNHVETTLAQALLTPASFGWLHERTTAVAACVKALRDALSSIDADHTGGLIESLADDLDQFCTALRSILDAARRCRPSEVRQLAAAWQPPATSPPKLRAVARELRKRRLHAALAVSGLGAEIRDIAGWLRKVESSLNAPIVAVVGAAGRGKTHLAAQLSAPGEMLSAGVFIQGGRLRAGGSLDDLARQIPGLKIQRFDDLLQALNSAGDRAGIRIPLLVDGLNEAERPVEWRDRLKELMPTLADFPNVLMIVTLREQLAETVILVEAMRVDLEWHEPEVGELVDAYFKHYLIDAAGAWLPREMFRTPLFVRLYCEAANAPRSEMVGAEVLPTSLIGVFEEYLEGFVDRLAHDAARKWIPADQIRRRLSDLAEQLWNGGVRRLQYDTAREILDAGESNWEESLYRRLEEEGVLLRDEADGQLNSEVGVVFDRFAGYLIADALLSRMTYGEIEDRLADAALWESLLGPKSHTLGEDVAVSLVGLVPRRFNRRHLWPSAPTSHRQWAIAQEIDSESEYLDQGTVDELANWIVGSGKEASGSPQSGHWQPFDRLWEVRSSTPHRLNARFLDRVLRMIPASRRDLVWTEWVRYHASDALVPVLRELVTHWTGESERAEADDLDALSAAWLLTSTNELVRDLATKALQRFGRPEPQRLFDLAAGLLDVDDLYLVERVIGAALGASTEHQMPDPGGPFEGAMAGWLVELRDRFLAEGSTPSSHEILRSYIRVTFELGGILHPGSVPFDVDPFALKFAATPPPVVMTDDDPMAAECATTLGMDFQNYVIGSAIPGRGNYQFEHSGYQRARSEVISRVRDLGWRADLFQDLDRSIAEASGRSSGRTRVERYGKKYGWIAYYELIGRLADAGQLRHRWVGGGRVVAPNIDPTFPNPMASLPLSLPEWVPFEKTPDEDWLRDGEIAVSPDVWRPEHLHGVLGGWLLVAGFLDHSRSGRRVFGFFHTLLLEPGDVAPALELIESAPSLGDRVFPDLATVDDVFVGEVPWSARFDDRDEQSWSPKLSRVWNDDGIKVGQVAVQLSTIEGGSSADLQGSYDVPSYEFATRLGLRRLPGSLDLVGLDGVRASAVFTLATPWRGSLLYIRQDLVHEFAGDREVLQVAWGERELDFGSPEIPDWTRMVYQASENEWSDNRRSNSSDVRFTG